MATILENILKEHSAEELIETAQEKLEDGSLDDVLEKVGIDSSKASGIAGFIASGFALFKKLFGKKEEAEEDEEVDEEEIDEEEIEEEEYDDEEELEEEEE